MYYGSPHGVAKMLFARNIFDSRESWTVYSAYIPDDAVLSGHRTEFIIVREPIAQEDGEVAVFGWTTAAAEKTIHGWLPTGKHQLMMNIFRRSPETPKRRRLVRRLPLSLYGQMHWRAQRSVRFTSHAWVITGGGTAPIHSKGRKLTEVAEYSDFSRCVNSDRSGFKAPPMTDPPSSANHIPSRDHLYSND